MAKRELRCGYRPLRSWERLFAYISFIILMGLTWHQAKTEAVSVELMLFTAALLIAVPCAFIAFWDARVTKRLRHREWKQRQATRRSQVTGVSVPEVQFTNAEGTWSFFEDPAPTTR